MYLIEGRNVVERSIRNSSDQQYPTSLLIH